MALTPLIRNLDRFAPLSEADRAVLLAAPWEGRSVSADQEIVRQGEIPENCMVIVEGYACRHKLLAKGRRSITNFLVAGDIFNLESLFLQKLDHSIGTLTPCKVAHIPHAVINRLTEEYPRIRRAIWQYTLVEGGVYRMWLTTVARRSGHERVAHFLCELLLRLKVVGLATDSSYQLPLTQEEIGDALGLSFVHVNRILQDLRGQGLIISEGRSVAINDWEGLTRAAQFDPAYLHLSGLGAPRAVAL